MVFNLHYHKAFVRHGHFERHSRKLVYLPLTIRVGAVALTTKRPNRECYEMPERVNSLAGNCNCDGQSSMEHCRIARNTAVKLTLDRGWLIEIGFATSQTISQIYRASVANAEAAQLCHHPPVTKPAST